MGRQEFVPGGVPGKIRVLSCMTALMWCLKNGMTLCKSSAGRFTCSGDNLSANLDKNLRFL
jgi:hypothetical protein